jgi:ubiquitin carboxyl-terminal hydrolase 34
VLEDENESEKITVMLQVAQKLGVACLDYLHNTYVQPRQTVVRAMLANIQTVIEACQEFFDFDSKDNLTRRFAEMSACKLFSHLLSSNM